MTSQASHETFMSFTHNGAHLGAVSVPAGRGSAAAASARAREIFGDGVWVTAVSKCRHCGEAHATNYDGEQLVCQECGTTAVSEREVADQGTSRRWALVRMGTGCGEVVAVFSGTAAYAAAQVRGKQDLVEITGPGMEPGGATSSEPVARGWLYEDGEFYNLCAGEA